MKKFTEYNIQDIQHEKLSNRYSWFYVTKNMSHYDLLLGLLDNCETSTILRVIKPYTDTTLRLENPHAEARNLFIRTMNERYKDSAIKDERILDDLLFHASNKEINDSIEAVERLL